jgi:hypothetical protein
MNRVATLIASMAVLGLCGPAHAGQYTCTFSLNGKEAGAAPCKIDTANKSSQTCQYKYAAPAKMVATCGASQIDANLDGLLCAFTSTTPNAADFLKDTVEPSISNTVASLHKKAGFAAGAVNIAAPTAANVSMGFSERKGAPQLAAVCSPTAAP